MICIVRIVRSVVPRAMIAKEKGLEPLAMLMHASAVQRAVG